LTVSCLPTCGKHIYMTASFHYKTGDGAYKTI